MHVTRKLKKEKKNTTDTIPHDHRSKNSKQNFNPGNTIAYKMDNKTDQVGFMTGILNWFNI